MSESSQVGNSTVVAEALESDGSEKNGGLNDGLQML
ncbi:unnamed protein product, partial [Allacma fusca]